MTNEEFQTKVAEVREDLKAFSTVAVSDELKESPFLACATKADGNEASAAFVFLLKLLDNKELYIAVFKEFNEKAKAFSPEESELMFKDIVRDISFDSFLSDDVK